MRAEFLVKLSDKYGLEHRLLDVSCASAFFLQEAIAVGWSVSGVERSPITASVAQDSRKTSFPQTPGCGRTHRACIAAPSNRSVRSYSFFLA